MTATAIISKGTRIPITKTSRAKVIMTTMAGMPSKAIMKAAVTDIMMNRMFSSVVCRRPEHH